MKDKNYLILKGGKEILLSRQEVLDSLGGVSALIRLREEEFKHLKKSMVYLSIFNLEETIHKIGNKYSIVKILRPGTYIPPVPPLLSLKKPYLVECIGVSNKLPIDKLTSKHFKYSFPHIKSKKQVLDSIFIRYKDNIPNLTKDRVKKMGVGFTLLKFLNKKI